jgi:hypothetical protein
MGHAKKTRHNIKKEKLIVHVVPIKVVKPIVEVTAQPVKLAKVPLRYPCIICSSSTHRAFNCLRKVEVQNMFQTKPNITPTIGATNFKPNNVPVNVVAIVTTRNQTLEQHLDNF